MESITSRDLQEFFMSYQSSKHLFIIPIISIMSISYKTIGNNFKWPFIAAKWSEFLHFFRDFKYLYHFESLNAVLYLSVHNWTKFLVDFDMGESLGLGKKSSGPETDTETWSWFRLPIPKPGFGRTLGDPKFGNFIWLQLILGQKPYLCPV